MLISDALRTKVFKLAGPSRNRKLSLNDAWKHYWSQLFLNGIEWRDDLGVEIRKRLYQPSDASGFMDTASPDLQSPSWGEDLDIAILDNFVVVRFQENLIGKYPIFAYGNSFTLSNWENNNPLDRASRLPGLTARHQVDCRDFVNAAVRECGNRIQNQLLHMLKETEQPKFEIYCRPGGDVFAKERALPAIALSKISRMDPVESDLCDRLGTPTYSYVQIKLRKPSKLKAGPRGSFDEQDAVLVERMKILIDERAVPNVRQAAMAVLADALGRETGSDATVSHDSVVRRLQRKFSRKYPNYTNSLGRKRLNRSS